MERSRVFLGYNRRRERNAAFQLLVEYAGIAGGSETTEGHASPARERKGNSSESRARGAGYARLVFLRAERVDRAGDSKAALACAVGPDETRRRDRYGREGERPANQILQD